MPSGDTVQERHDKGDLRPIPDPTALTTQQLYREVETVRSSVIDKVEALSNRIETRISAMDKAIVLVQTMFDRVPSRVEESVGQLRQVVEEKFKVTEERFKSISIQFTERDTRTEQTSRDSKVAVDAALQAAKEAVGEQNKSNALAIAKSEATFTKQIDQIGVLISTMQKGIDDKIDDIKTRLTSMESNKIGRVEERVVGVETKKSMTDTLAIVISIVAVVISLAISWFAHH